AQQHRDGFTGAILTVVDECAQWMKPVAAFEVRGGVFFVGVGGDEGGIDIDDQWFLLVDGVIRCRGAGSGPGVGAGGGAGAADGSESGVGVGGQHADQPGDGRVGGNRAEQFGVSPQLCDVGETVSV